MECLSSEKEEIACSSKFHVRVNCPQENSAHISVARKPVESAKTCFSVRGFPRPLVMRACVHVGKIRLARETSNDSPPVMSPLSVMFHIHSPPPSLSLSCLLFDDGRVLKLCDFGTARKLQHTLTNAVGTVLYMAPEVIKSKSLPLTVWGYWEKVPLSTKYNFEMRVEIPKNMMVLSNLTFCYR